MNETVNIQYCNVWLGWNGSTVMCLNDWNDIGQFYVSKARLAC